MIPNEFIDSLILKADISLIVGAYVDLTAAGAQMRGPCPFCQGKNFNVSGSKSIFKCFNCGKGGNVITFLENIEKISFPEVVRMLAKKLDIELPKEQDS